MERKVNIQDWQKVTETDFDNFGVFPRESLDHVVGDLLIPDKAFTGFAAVQSSAAHVTVGSGRLFSGGVVYFNSDQGGTDLDLLASLPAVTRRYIAVVVWGQAIDSDTEPRTFLTDATTRATVARVVSTVNERHANISTVAGVEGPDPQKPAIASNVLVVAWVLLDTAGIVSITVPAENRAPSLRGADARLNENDSWRTRVGTRLDTLGSDLAGLAGRLSGTARQAFASALAADVARIKESINLPATYTQWGSDHFLSLAASDIAFVDYLAAVEEGCRFPDAAVESDQLGLLNQYDANVVQQDFFVLPAYDPFARISVTGNDSEQAISQYPFQTVTATQKTRGRARYRYGEWETVCTNFLWHFTGTGGAYNGEYAYNDYDPVEGIFKMADGEIWQIDPTMRTTWQDHTYIRARRVWIDGFTVEAYIDNVVGTSSISGSIMAQTFLNTQDGWLTRLDLFLTRVALTGDVTVMITDTVNGAPDYSKVIAKTVVTAANLHTYPTATPVEFIPTFLGEGKRYAFVVVTPGNHYIGLVSNNKYAQGTLFYSTDGVFAQGDLTEDVAFVAYFAQFRATRVEVQLLPLTLSGGIANIDILCQAITPGQTGISWEVQVAGLGWIALDQQSGAETYPLNGLPALLPFRVVLLGTTQSMPGFGVGSNSRTLARRPREDFKHISSIRTMPESTTINTVHVDVRLENWRGTPYHTFVAKILTGVAYATVETYDAVQEIQASDDPNAILREYTFTLAGAVGSYRIRLEGTTDNALACFHVAERIDVALTV